MQFINEQDNIEKWIKEYIKVEKCTHDADDIITISLKEIENKSNNGKWRN